MQDQAGQAQVLKEQPPNTAQPRQHDPNSHAYTYKLICCAVTWPQQLGVVDASVWQQWLWCFMASVSGMIGLGYGPFPPRTWGEVCGPVQPLAHATGCLRYSVTCCENDVKGFNA